MATNIGTFGNKLKNVNLNKKRWYKLDIIQYQWNNKVRKLFGYLKFWNYLIIYVMIFTSNYNPVFLSIVQHFFLLF